MDQIVINGTLYKKGDSVLLKSEFGEMTGKIYDIGEWRIKQVSGVDKMEPYVHVKYDREGAFGIKECWLWNEKHFKTLSLPAAGCRIDPVHGWVVSA